MAQGYANPNALVTTEWVAAHAKDANVRVLESNEDPLLYDIGHVPGAQKLDWQADLNDPVTRDFIGPEAFAELAGRLGIAPGTTVVVYGDRNNWWAAYAYWIFKLYHHADVRVMNGGRAKWIEEGRELGKDAPSYPAAAYPTPSVNGKIRAFQDDVLGFIGARRGERTGSLPGNRALVDVRSPGEYSGQVTHMPDYPQEGVLRGGHIPGAHGVPWKRAANDDGTFKSVPDLKAIYEGEIGLSASDDVVVYCRIGERSSHTWFVLTQLLGYPTVSNYDGSWTEWGNSVRVPIEKP